ncbi:MAG: 3-hydroxyacyl-CoA dehydrogenase family protein, partial [Planctomycetota bacterium]
MTSSDMLVLGEAMSEPEAAMHIAALVQENQLRNRALYHVGEVPPVERVGIVGAGVMGSIVAAAAIRYGVPVVITDQNPAALASLMQAIQMRMPAEGLDSLPVGDDRVAELLTITPSLADVAACDLIVESIVENVTTKRNFYASLELLCADDTLIVSNTSTLPIGELAAHLRQPERFCGLHYFPPIGEQKMFEIIPGAKTNEVTTARLIRFAERLGRIPVVVADGRGFVVNRILMAYMSAGI